MEDLEKLTGVQMGQNPDVESIDRHEEMLL
jgi:hypothetical protein